MREHDFETVKRHFSCIESGDCSDKVKCFAEAIGILAVQGGFEKGQKLIIFDKLFNNKDLIFPLLGLDKTVMNETDMEVALTHGVWDMLDSYMAPFESHELSEKEILMEKLTKLDEIKERIDDLEQIDDLFGGYMYIRFERLFPQLLSVINSKYTYEVESHKPRI